MPEQDRELLVEVTRIGAWLRVAVIDAATGREAVVRGPVNAGEAGLITLATRQLQAPAKPAARDPGFCA